MPIGPIWGSKCWRILTVVSAILILAWGIWTMVSDYLAGYQQWWYNSTLVIFAISLLGLVLLVRQGLDAFNNLTKYGFHPDKSEWESEEEQGESEEFESHPDIIRTYDAHDEN